MKLHVPIQRAFAVMALERAIPAFMPLFVGASALFALLWTGSYALLPPVWHVTALIGSAVFAAFLLSWGTFRFLFPSKGEALRRIEERNDLKPGILDGVFARSFGSDEGNPLWQAARQRLAHLIGKPKAPFMKIDWRGADPLRTRYIAGLLILMAIISTQGSQDGLRASLLPPAIPGDPILVDAWIEPPDYTGMASTVIKQGSTRRMMVTPEDSTLHVRLRAKDGRPVRGVLTFNPEEGRRFRVRGAAGEASAVTLPLTENGTLAVTTGGQTNEIVFRVVQDRPPQITVLDEPDTSTGSIRMNVNVQDDYPIAEGRMVLSLIPGQKLSRDAPMPDNRILEAPEIIELADLAGQPGERAVEAETVEHPWAGLLVKASLEVTDGRGQTATSEPFAFTMPERTFYNPLSKVVIAERQKLAMAPSHLNNASKMISALTVAPDLFDVEASAHLMLKATAQAVAAAKQRDVPDLIDSFWPLAIELEDDGLAFAKAQLDAAEKALREALQNGAPQDELQRRIAELREAMNNYLRALAESGFADTELQEGQTALAETDLEELLRQMEELANQGSRAEAEALLRQLEALLQSLRFANGAPSNRGQDGQQGQGEGQPGQSGTPGMAGNGGPGGQGQQALSGTGDLIQQQRELADQTFSARRGDRGSGGLGGEQRSLSEQLDQLEDSLPQSSDETAEAFRRAREAMGRAAEALDRDDLARAQALQEQALGALREGGQELAELFEGEAGSDGEQGTMEGTDPFGRAWRGEGGPSPEEFGLYDPERIRALIAEIRERLKDPSLGEAERDYLESLLERF
ncbi:MAG: DUF4175 family protein [Pseudomonadota bacterium]